MNTNNTLHTLMREATRLTQAGQLNAATQALQRALGGSMTGSRFFKDGAQSCTDADPATAAHPAGASSLILDGCVFETSEPATARPDPHWHQQGPHHADAGAVHGAFTGARHTHARLTRRYKLYTPPSTSGQASALVVMLHGCTQNPDDFAAGTDMNALAREQGFMVLYPEQAHDANPQRCWNWLKRNHQKRGSGEPALIASLAQVLVRQHGIDPRRVYIAGLSAGGAMAAIVATAYPDVFAAAGVHSGLPSGAAGNAAEALMLMKSGGGNGANGTVGRAGQGAKPLVQVSVPTIVFHGDQDQTVHPRNGEQVLAAVLASRAHPGGSAPGAHRAAKVEQGTSPHGRRFTRSTYCDDSGAPLAEHWLLHGAGHAWSGGRASGSHTDATGPDATREMVRFFFSQPRGQTH
ncbi:alpha/beta hydrolase family esterase [Rhodoferax sp.]|uniref:extracellular catalytic domain type 1 short-chain-length polyhydroxyalkanoate depolymerase n=1 Tax=Rhodoferax sp. TaxID=50421 RepID=UPI002762C876|nr:PHB depolymerase family esterase [Rhodoferax sp.]